MGAEGGELQSSGNEINRNLGAQAGSWQEGRRRFPRLSTEKLTARPNEKAPSESFQRRKPSLVI